MLADAAEEFRPKRGEGACGDGEGGAECGVCLGLLCEAPSVEELSPLADVSIQAIWGCL